MHELGKSDFFLKQVNNDTTQLHAENSGQNGSNRVNGVSVSVYVTQKGFPPHPFNNINERVREDFISGFKPC